MHRFIIAGILVCQMSLPVWAQSETSRTADFVDIECPYTLENGEPVPLNKAPIDLLYCLDDPDPAVRDGFAYTHLVAGLRDGEHTPEELRALLEYLTLMVDHADDDPNGFRGPFAILGLAEVARTDRIEAWMTPFERLDLFMLGAEYLKDLDDYRGFDREEGWRHGVAHTADLFLQLSLNPAVDIEGAAIMLDAIAAKVAPQNAPAYVFGEPDRLARPVLFFARADMLTDEIWSNFFDGLKPDETDPRWQDPYMNEAGLRAIHNTKAFAYSIYTNASASETTSDDILAEKALDLLISLP